MDLEEEESGVRGEVFRAIRRIMRAKGTWVENQGESVAGEDEEENEDPAGPPWNTLRLTGCSLGGFLGHGEVTDVLMPTTLVAVEIALY